VEIRATARSIEVLLRGARVAAHLRSHKRGGYTTVPEHLPAAHRAQLEWSPGRLIRWGKTIGPACAALIERLLESRKHPEQGYRACLGILRLARQHGAARLQAACTRALALGNPSYACVASILKNKLESQPLAPESAWSAPTHDNVRGSEYYH
jgi:transposase